MKILLFLLVIAACAGVWKYYSCHSWDKTFPKSDKVDVKKVSFVNRYGIELVGDLYTPKNIGKEKLPAIAVSGPFGAVKEQSSGLYAQTMAEKGFVTLAFDPQKILAQEVINKVPSKMMRYFILKENMPCPCGGWIGLG